MLFRLTFQTTAQCDITRSSSCSTSRIASSCMEVARSALSPRETACDIKDSARNYSADCGWCLPASCCSCQTSTCPASSCSVVSEFVVVSLLVSDDTVIPRVSGRNAWSKDCGHGCLSVTATLVSTIWILRWGFRNVHYRRYRFANFLGSRLLVICNKDNKDETCILHFIKDFNASM